jgi:hypothetical protein
MKDASCQYELSTIPLPWQFAELGEQGEIINKPNPTERLIWSGNLPKRQAIGEPPTIGTRVNVPMNGLGTGTVSSYFTEHGFLGVIVKLDNPPDWHIKQNVGRKYQGHALVFGAEIGTL